jgi:hypothetical protein
LLNSAFVRKQSLALAERLLKDDETDAERVAETYRRVLGRSPTEKEAERALDFLGEYESLAREFYPDNLAPPPRLVKKPVAKKVDDPPFDPDQIDQTGEPVTEESIRPKDAKTAAWLAFAQALLASAEFRYVK